METRQPPPDMDVEETFNTFVEDFGGELVDKLFEGVGERPNNADYFFRNRTVVAELKCLKKNYFNDQKVGEKLNAMMNSWLKQGLLQPENIKDGMFQTGDLPPQCTIEVFKAFSSPIKEAVEKANKQIRETRKYFGVPDAKGLLILANDGNYSINPQLMVQILNNLFKSRFTNIDSFVFFTPNMRAYTNQIDRQFHVWLSGRCRPSSNAVNPAFLGEIQKGWVSFLERRTGEKAAQFVVDRNILSDIKLIM